MKPKLKEQFSIQDAIENLEALDAIDLDAPGPIGVIGHRIVTDEEGLPGPGVQWLSGEGEEVLLEVLDATLRAVHQHLMTSEGQESTHTVEAMIELSGKAAHKLERYLTVRLDRTLEKISERPSYRALQEYYHQRVQEKVREEEAIETGLQDMEAVRKDCDYEFFYIRHEDGTPHYNIDILRHTRLACDFEAEADTFEEDPLLQVRAMRDRDLHMSASQILALCRHVIADFYKLYRKIHESSLAQELSQAIIALLLAANPRHLLQNTTGKEALRYFEDFQWFLRRALKTTEYQKLIAYPPEKNDRSAHVLLGLAHALSYGLFHRSGGIKQEAIGLIHRTARRGKKKTASKEESLWSQFLIEDENFRSLLAKFPSGPLFKTLDLLRETETPEHPLVFDPIGQQNLPLKLFEMEMKGKRLEVLHLPSPIRQRVLHKVEILDEFRAMLRELSQSKPPHRHLLINLQDRTSWKEASRAKGLESLERSAEFSPLLTVVTLAKGTPFYHQTGNFERMNQASEFIETFEKQLFDPEGGFYFPSSFSRTELDTFAKKTMHFLHTQLFGGKATLERREREDFIELFYQFLIAKCIEQYAPDSISFTCKDALDTGAVQTASFFAFWKLLKGDLSQKEDQDLFRWLLYTPALFVRERAVNLERLTRALTSLERFDQALLENRKVITKDLL
ncbi:MAG: hypothetical protein KGJ02_06695 [Verrucomicrobiota bacterium]|nr:hypothetical protein [Verrucomicrobiota bacterium]